MAPKVIDACKLCDSVTVLRDSHIVPQWVYRRMAHQYGGSETPVRIESGTVKLDGRQLHEHMLCDACEKELRERENYVGDVCSQRSGAFPAYDRCTPVHRIGEDAYVAAAQSDLDCEALAFFAASVIWRASVSRSSATVDLGSTYERAFRSYLRGGRWPPHTQLLLDLMRNPTVAAVHGLLSLPASRKMPDGNRYEFTAAGVGPRAAS